MARARRQRSSRGFTLIELSVVVIIVAVFAALAIPQVTRQMRDRRVNEAAQRVAHLYRQARLRAIGQGGAVNVIYSSGTNNQGQVEVRDALVGKPSGSQVECALIPSPSCINTTWENLATDGTARSVMTLDVGKEGAMDNIFVKMNQDAASGGSSTSYMELCFTPLGRTFIRYANGAAAWQSLNSVPTADVFRGTESNPIGLIREVVILPSGMTRVRTRPAG